MCLGRNALARGDLERFLESHGAEPAYAAMSGDARKRLRRLGARVRPEPTVHRNPALTLRLAGGYRRLGLSEGWDYGTIGGSGSIRLWRALSVLVAVDIGISDINRTDEGEPIVGSDGSHERSVLASITLGPQLRFRGVVMPELGVGLRIAPDPAGTAPLPVLLGPVLLAGLSIPMGTSPLSLAFQGELGLALGRPVLGATAGLDLRFAGPSNAKSHAPAPPP